MKKVIITLLAAALIACTAVATPQWGSSAQPWEITLGAHTFTGDKEANGIQTGFMVGVDRYFAIYGPNSEGFIGVRGIVATGNGWRSETFGGHYGFKVSLGSGGTANPIYLKAAGGYYRKELTNGASASKWDFGWFAGIGLDIPSAWSGSSSFSIESGFFSGPTVSLPGGDIDNTGWYGVAGFRF